MLSDIRRIPSGIFLPGTELLQSPFRTEFSKGSRSRSLSPSCGVITDFCGVIADPCGVVAIPEVIGGPAGSDAAMPIVARLAKLHRTLLNIVKHHETHVKHCKT